MANIGRTHLKWNSEVSQISVLHYEQLANLSCCVCLGNKQKNNSPTLRNATKQSFIFFSVPFFFFLIYDYLYGSLQKYTHTKKKTLRMVKWIFIRNNFSRFSKSTWSAVFIVFFQTYEAYIPVYIFVYIFMHICIFLNLSVQWIILLLSGHFVWISKWRSQSVSPVDVQFCQLAINFLRQTWIPVGLSVGAHWMCFAGECCWAVQVPTVLRFP